MLKGAASEWYLDEVEAWNRPNQHWFFEDLVCAMYKRFIHEVTAQNAGVKFDHATYSKLKCALAFHNDLKRYAGCMVIPPDKYSMKKKFLKGLPIDMIDHLLKTRWVTAEHTSFDVILEEAKAMECSMQAFNLYKKERQSRPSHNDTERSGNNGNTDHSTRPRRVVRFIKKSKRSHPSGDSHSKRYVTSNNTSKSGYRHNSGNHGNHHTNDNSRPSGSQNTHSRQPESQNNSGNRPQPTNNSELTCYRCGKKGHIRPDCPENGP